MDLLLFFRKRNSKFNLYEVVNCLNQLKSFFYCQVYLLFTEWFENLVPFLIGEQTFGRIDVYHQFLYDAFVCVDEVFVLNHQLIGFRRVASLFKLDSFDWTWNYIVFFILRTFLKWLKHVLNILFQPGCPIMFFYLHVKDGLNK